MRSAIAILLFVVSLSTFVYMQDTGDEQQIRKLMDEIAKAYVSRDAEPIERIYAENYISIRSKPVYNSREQLIAMLKADAVVLKAGKKLEYQTHSYDSNHPQIRLFGSAAVVTAMKNNNWEYRESKCLTRYQATDVWVKRDGNWRLVAGHSTTFQCDQPPWFPGHPAITAIPTETRPLTLPDSAAENEIRTVLNIQDEAGANRVFAKDYIGTNLAGEVLPDRSPLTAALVPGKVREDEVIQVFDDAAVYLFRSKSPARPGRSSSSQQFMVVLVKTDGRWRIAASHVTKYME